MLILALVLLFVLRQSLWGFSKLAGKNWGLWGLQDGFGNSSVDFPTIPSPFFFGGDDETMSIVLSKVKVFFLENFSFINLFALLIMAAGVYLILFGQSDIFYRCFFVGCGVVGGYILFRL